MAVGIMLLADISSLSDLVYVGAYFLAGISFLSGALLYLFINPIKSDYDRFFGTPVEIDNDGKLNMVWLIFLLSIFVTTLYYVSVGSNIFLNIALGLTVDDFDTERLASYSGEDYFAPGYANQFKNILLPLTTSILGALYFYQKQTIRFNIILLFSLILLPLALLGTGQRAFLAYSAAAFVFAIASLSNLNIRKLIVPGIIAFSLFVFMTYIYKSDQVGNSENIIFSSIAKALERFIYTEQEEVIVTFRILYERDMVFFYEWYEQLRGILPGFSGSYLQHDLYSYRHGTDRGTAAISTVSSVIYNGSFLFVPIFYSILGFLYFSLYHRFLKGRRSIIRVFSYCALFFYLSAFVSGGPSSLINNGAMAILLFMLLRKLSFRSTQTLRV